MAAWIVAWIVGWLVPWSRKKGPRVLMLAKLKLKCEKTPPEICSREKRLLVMYLLCTAVGVFFYSKKKRPLSPDLADLNKIPPVHV